MDELAKITNAISTCNEDNVASQIMVFCRAITPQFYKNMSDLDIKAERSSISLLTQHIEQVCLGEMCRLAVINYARTRSENSKTFFDINYILTFYKQAFNKIFCENVNLPKGSSLKKSNLDYDTMILTEIYETKEKEEIVIKEIKSNDEVKKNNHIYSTKYFNGMFSSLEDIEI